MLYFVFFLGVVVLWLVKCVVHGYLSTFVLCAVLAYLPACCSAAKRARLSTSSLFSSPFSPPIQGSFLSVVVLHKLISTANNRCLGRDESGAKVTLGITILLRHVIAISLRFLHLNFTFLYGNLIFTCPVEAFCKTVGAEA